MTNPKVLRHESCRKLDFQPKVWLILIDLLDTVRTTQVDRYLGDVTCGIKVNVSCVRVDLKARRGFLS